MLIMHHRGPRSRAPATPPFCQITPRAQTCHWLLDEARFNKGSALLEWLRCFASWQQQREMANGANPCRLSISKFHTAHAIGGTGPRYLSHVFPGACELDDVISPFSTTACRWASRHDQTASSTRHPLTNVEARNKKKYHPNSKRCVSGILQLLQLHMQGWCRRRSRDARSVRAVQSRNGRSIAECFVQLDGVTTVAITAHEQVLLSRKRSSIIARS